MVRLTPAGEATSAFPHRIESAQQHAAQVSIGAPIKTRSGRADNPHDVAALAL
jgi:hypothetical protein